MVQAQRTTANLLEPQLHRASKVCRRLAQEVGVVRLYRTFSLYLVTGETRSAGCLYKSSGWFKHLEPHRTYSNHNSTELARCGEVCHRRSGWVECTTFSIYSVTEETRSAGCLSTSSGWEPLRTSSNLQHRVSKVWRGSSTANLIEPTRTTTAQR